MAGTLKPDDSLLLRKKEVKCEILECGDGFWESTTPYGLLDGTGYTGYTDNTVCYFYEYDDQKAYFKFKVYNKCNIWAIGTDGNFVKIPKLKLCDKDGIDITDKYLNQNDSDYVSGKWTKMISALPQGEYYLYNNNSRAVIGEWYCEKVGKNYAIKNNNKIFLPNEDNYDASTGHYNSITTIPSDYSDTDDLFDTPDYFTDKTKRVIDLFDGDIQIINLEYENGDKIVLNGIKSNRELVVASGDINNGVAQTINSIVINNTVDGNSSLKLAVSTDSGQTWLTYSNGSWSSLNITIPDKTDYNLLTTSELTQWNQARDTIFSNGIDIETFNTLDFNTLTETSIAPNTIKFAYVLNRPSYSDSVSTNKMTWNFDAKGSMKKMKESEYDIEMYEKQIKFTSLVDNAMVITNIII